MMVHDKVVAFIPVRGGSKSIPLKNIKLINGKPLVYWTIKAASESRCLDKVFVCTDSQEIKSTVNDFNFENVEVIERSAQSATDTAPTETVMLDFCNQYSFETIVLIQATSPLLTSQDIDGGLELYASKDTDSVLSVVRQKRFRWKTNENGWAISTNYDIFKRPRRQDFEGDLVENGAFYITSKSDLLKSHNRISGHIKAYQMCEDSFFEIDEPSDWGIIEILLKKRQRILREGALSIKHLKLVATDCDGVLTDAGMYYTEKGDEMKKFNTLDGMAFQLLREKDIKTAIITAENNPLVTNRGEKLKVDDVLLGVTDKLDALKGLCKKYQISLEECAYIGDDIYDISAIAACGFGCVPNGAFDSIKKHADFVTTRNGGNGCFREVVELIIHSNTSNKVKL